MIWYNRVREPADSSCLRIEVVKVFDVGLLTGVRQYLNFVREYMISSNDFDVV